jgi:RNA polymerase sigma-70 factor, ECF subfamily
VALSGEQTAEPIRSRVDAVYRTESRRVLATLIRLLGDFDVAEEAMHDAFAVALQQWESRGVPHSPRAWLISTARFRAIDMQRRDARLDRSEHAVANALHAAPEAMEESDVADDQLRLIFTCCHPALARDAQVALTLREVCGLTTEEIAFAFLTPAPTVAQRIVRAKQKIRTAKIPYQLPDPAELPSRLDSVLQVVYLVFNEGYLASSGDSLTRHDLSAEAIRLCRLLRDMLREPEVDGLLALMLLHDSRRLTRTGPDGSMVLLDEQDRTQWNSAMIVEGCSLVEGALASRRFGPYTLQAAIAAIHAESPTAQDTDWSQIIGLYDVLRRADTSPVIELNRAVAVAMRDGPAAGLSLIEPLIAGGALSDYHLAHSARADLCRRLGRLDDAAISYRAALSLVQQVTARRYLERRLAEVGGNP